MGCEGSTGYVCVFGAGGVDPEDGAETEVEGILDQPPLEGGAGDEAADSAGTKEEGGSGADSFDVAQPCLDEGGTIAGADTDAQPPALFDVSLEETEGRAADDEDVGTVEGVAALTFDLAVIEVVAGLTIFTPAAFAIFLNSRSSLFRSFSFLASTTS